MFDVYNMLLRCVVIELETWSCGSTIIENRKQQNTANVLLLVENCDVKLEILNKSTHLNQSETQITVMSDFFVKVFACPRNYYSDNNVQPYF